MPALVGLWCVGALLAAAALAVVIGRWSLASVFIYFWCLTVSLIALLLALMHLMGGGDAAMIALPVGLPGIGARFRIDALSAFFLIVANLGGAAASLYAIGYGAHETAPQRVLPFYPAYLAGMNLVVLADDAFSFL